MARAYRKTPGGLVPLTFKRKLPGGALADAGLVIGGQLIESGEEPGPATPGPGVGSGIFPRAAWLHTPIPPNPVLDPNSASLAQQLVTGNRVAATYDLANPVYEVSADDPVHSTALGNLDIRSNGFTADIAGIETRIPAYAIAAPGGDGWSYFNDRSPSPGFPNGKCSGIWQMRREGNVIVGSSGGVWPLDSDATTHKVAHVALTDSWLQALIAAGAVRANDAVEWFWPQPLTQGTASGIPALAGLVTPADLASGAIEHTMVCALGTWITSGPVRRGGYRYPGRSTDGHASPYDATKQFVLGQRFRFPPSFNMNTIADPYVRMLGVGGQKYGFVPTDTSGGAAVTVGSQLAMTPAEQAIYDSFGVGRPPGYVGLQALPWDQVQVLNHWDGTATGSSNKLLPA